MRLDLPELQHRRGADCEKLSQMINDSVEQIEDVGMNPFKSV